MSDTARSDLALAIATLLIGPRLLAPLADGGGIVGAVRAAVLLLALTAVVPVLLGRARGDLTAALALDGRSPAAAAASGLPLVAPAAVAGAVAMSSAGAAPSAAALGRLSGSPLQALVIASAALGAAVLVTFLATRTRAASMRSPVWSLHRLVRTIGIAAVGAALALGLLRVPLGASPVRVVVDAAALLAIVLLADRLVGPGSVPRIAVILPAAIVAWSHVSALGFGAGLLAAALGAGVAAVMAAVALGPRGLPAVVPLAVAVHLWPTCLSPLAQVRGLC